MLRYRAPSCALNRRILRKAFTVELAKHRVCIVGSGPSGFYCAKYLLENPSVSVDIIEKQPFPFGKQIFLHGQYVSPTDMIF